jgi:hypothetical protein
MDMSLHTASKWMFILFQKNNMLSKQDERVDIW